MRRTTPALFILLLALASPALAGGGAKGDWELGIYGGYGWPDDYGVLHPKNHLLYGGRIGHFLTSAWSLEASAQAMNTHSDFDDPLLLPNVDVKLDAIRGNLLYNFGTPESKVRPFLTVGGGSEKTDVDPGGFSSDPGWNAGAGLRLFPSPHWNVRLDGRFVRVHVEDIVDEYESNVEAALGLGVLFGGHAGEKTAEVVHENAPPTATLVCDRPELGPGETMNATATATDADNDALTYAWSASAGQVTGNGPTATFTFGNATPPATATITVQVSDGHGHTTPATCTVSMKAPPPKPEAVSCLAGGFPRNLSRLNNVDKACLDDYVQRLKGDPRAHVVVIGYADSHERSPDTIARQRAQAISDYLVHEGGIDASRVTVRSGGAAKPLDTGTDLAAQAKNRRCEVWFVPEGAGEPE